MTRRRTRGFNLIEALLSFALFLLVLSLIAQGLRQLSRITRHFDARSQTFTLALSLLNRVSTDVQEATEVIVPAPGDTATYSQLELRRVEPAQWANYYPTPAPTPWNPRDPALLQEVVYALVGNQLRYQLDGPSGTEDLLLAENVQGLTTRRDGSVSLEVRLSFQEGGQLVSFTRQVHLPQYLRRVHP